MIGGGPDGIQMAVLKERDLGRALAFYLDLLGRRRSRRWSGTAHQG